MYRFLFVEDDRLTREQVASYLRESFPAAAVETAENVAEAAEKITEAVKPFDCVILDFMLPKSKGRASEGDVSLCELVRQLMPRAVVAHVSAYLDDAAELEQHMKKEHREHLDTHSFELPKDEDWVDRLGTILRGHFYGREIRQQLDDLFGREDEESMAREGRVERPDGYRAVGDPTFRLAHVSRDIVAHWEDLDDALRHRIRRLFRVIEEEGQPVRIGLL